jgi:threonine synthase
MDWHLECSDCDTKFPPDGLPTVCSSCHQPLLVRYPLRSYQMTDRAEIRRGWSMWRYRAFLPILPGEVPISLGEGDTPLLPVPRLGSALNLGDVWLKDESANATGSFKARGLSAAVTRAVAGGATSFTLPTAGNAGVAAAAYGARAGVKVRVYAPLTTPATIVQQMEIFGGEVVLIDGHIGDCGKASREWAAASGAFDLSTLREPYRIEGKKTLGLELAIQLNWTLPQAIIYPTGGGTGLIGMWKAFEELRAIGWVTSPMPRMYSVQSSGCAPIVKAFEAGSPTSEAWVDPITMASGLRVPAPLGGPLILQILRETGGSAVAVDDSAMEELAVFAARQEGIDVSPEGGASIAAALELQSRGEISRDDRVVIFNTGAGWLYRQSGTATPELS